METGSIVLFWPVVWVFLFCIVIVGSLGWVVEQVVDRVKTPKNPW